jgi:Ca2+/Na+ antiporter
VDIDRSVMQEITKILQNANGFTNYDRQTLFFGLLLFVAIVLSLTKTFPKTYGFVILLIAFALYFTNVFAKSRNEALQNSNKETMIKLLELSATAKAHTEKYNKKNFGGKVSQNKIQDWKLSSLYIDANMIHFLHSILPMYQYNPNEFYKLLIGTNNLLRLREEVEVFYEANGVYPENIAEIFESALILRTKTMNNVHNFIYSVPKQKSLYKYIDDIVKRYYVLTTRHTDALKEAHSHHDKINGVRNSTKIVIYQNTKPSHPSDHVSTTLKEFYY